MNCLWADPTTEKELPLIDAAADAGCEYYCIDAGWYADGEWWDGVGEWKESKKRFPNGIKEVTDYIRKKGMIPGAWLEIEVMGIKCPKVKECDDTWFFMGTSISQMGMKQFTVDSNFAQLIHARFADYYPAMLRGGIGCVTSQGVVDALKYYAEYVGNVKFWAIEMGTNDAWGGSNANVETFTKNLQTIIDTAKAHGVTPIIARMIATNPEIAKWQVHQDYLDAIDKLTKDNELPAGPDFYNYFLEHPEELSASDGVHPAEPKGGQSMHRLWAEAAALLYKDDPCANRPDVVGCGGTSLPKMHNVNFALPHVSVSGREISISGLRENDRVTIMDAMGHVVWNGSTGIPKMRAGNYFVNVRGANSNYSTKVSVK